MRPAAFMLANSPACCALAAQLQGPTCQHAPPPNVSLPNGSLAALCQPARFMPQPLPCNNKQACELANTRDSKHLANRRLMPHALLTISHPAPALSSAPLQHLSFKDKASGRQSKDDLVAVKEEVRCDGEKDALKETEGGAGWSNKVRMGEGEGGARN